MVVRREEETVDHWLFGIVWGKVFATGKQRKEKMMSLH